MFVIATQASSILGVSLCTLCRWHRNSKITAFRSPGGVRLFDVSNIVDSTTTTTTTPSPLPKKDSSMLGSLVSSKKRTLSGRSNSSFPDSQPMNSSVISGQELTSNTKDCKSYWNNHVKVLSERLWLSTMIDYAGSPTNSSSTNSHSTLQNLWFSLTIQQPTNMSCPKISLPSTSSSAD